TQPPNDSIGSSAVGATPPTPRPTLNSVSRSARSTPYPKTTWTPSTVGSPDTLSRALGSTAARSATSPLRNDAMVDREATGTEGGAVPTIGSPPGSRGAASQAPSAIAATVRAETDSGRGLFESVVMPRFEARMTI